MVPLTGSAWLCIALQLSIAPWWLLLLALLLILPPLHVAAVVVCQWPCFLLAIMPLLVVCESSCIYTAAAAAASALVKAERAHMSTCYPSPHAYIIFSNWVHSITDISTCLPPMQALLRHWPPGGQCFPSHLFPALLVQGPSGCCYCSCNCWPGISHCCLAHHNPGHVWGADHRNYCKEWALAGREYHGYRCIDTYCGGVDLVAA